MQPMREPQLPLEQQVRERPQQEQGRVQEPEPPQPLVRPGLALRQACRGSTSSAAQSAAPRC